ncbi:hypothetical protein J6590_000064 [Homalodisca vitripennis]|nr:hypothetical protein J6590_000064 [Homalodisca vitripennis]
MCGLQSITTVHFLESLGNHEFDGGPEGLSPFIANSSVPIVCSNIDHSARPEFQNLTQLVPSKVLDVDGVKVGVIGYLTPETKFISLLGDDIKLKDEITEIKKEVERLKQEGVKILIALGHSGFSTDKLIAEHVPDLDVVVGGHTNTFLFTGHDPDIEKSEGSYPTVVTQPSGRKVLVVQAYAFTKYLGRLELTFDDEGDVIHSTGNPILLDDSFRKDGAVERAVLKYGNELKHLTGRKIGFSKAYLDGNQNCRLGECNIGNLVTDALVDDNAKDFYGSGWTDAPVAMVQGGGLRSSIDTKETGGVIAYSDLLEVLPFQNSVERLTLTGSVLMRVLEHSVSRYSKEERVGGFMQYSGIQVEYDLSKPPQKRVVSALVRCGDCKVPHYLPLDVNKVYSVLTSTFLADGGDGYSMFEYAKERKTLCTDFTSRSLPVNGERACAEPTISTCHLNGGFQLSIHKNLTVSLLGWVDKGATRSGCTFSDVDAVENYLKRVSPVYPEVSGRIRFVDHKQISRSSASSSYSTNYLLLLAVFIVTCLPKA